MVQTVGPEPQLLVDHATAPVTSGQAVLDMRGRYSLSLIVAGTFTGTVDFEATIDGVFWGPLELRRLDAKNQVGTSATTQSAWTLDARIPMLAIRCTVATLSAGDVSVWALRGA